MTKILKIRRVIYITALSQMLLVPVAFSAWSQVADLDGQYRAMIENSETYDKYKVISKTRLDDLWADVLDELAMNARAISSLEASMKTANVTSDSLTARVNQLTRQLNESKHRNSSIAFLGMDFSHTLYHTIVWSIISLLALAITYFGFRFKMSGDVVNHLLLEKEAIASECEEHKFNAHQKMLKTKRELQTALNQLEELKTRKTAT